jgi:hypothetical protein
MPWAARASTVEHDVCEPSTTQRLAFGSSGLRSGQALSWRRSQSALARRRLRFPRRWRCRSSSTVPDVTAYASRETTMDRRHRFAAFIRSAVREPGFGCEERVAADDLEAFALELEDETLTLDPACGVACLRLLSDPVVSPLLNPVLPPEGPPIARPPDPLRLQRPPTGCLTAAGQQA